MEDFLTKLRRSYAAGSLLTKLLYINVGVFLLVRALLIVLRLFNVEGAHVLALLQAPSDVRLLLLRPWTLVTYMFLHIDVLHLLFNMLWLYAFGRIFLLFLDGRRLVGIYITGGIAGALLYVVAYAVFPYFRDMGMTSYLMGASASVMAIVFAVSFYRKDYTINLLFIGQIKLLYLALGVFAIDFFSITSANAGGHIAHIGGALWGLLFALQIQRGRDLTAPINALIDRLANMKKRRELRMKVSVGGGGRAESDAAYRERKRREADALDEILDKLRRSGYESLSSDEKKALFDASRAQGGGGAER